MSAFRFEIANAYSGLTNVVLRVAPAGSAHDAPAVLVNAHFDSTLGTKGECRQLAARTMRPPCWSTRTLKARWEP
jgi:hypothetical protein